jgi:hypothetical protein
MKYNNFDFLLKQSVALISVATYSETLQALHTATEDITYGYKPW